MGRNQVWRVAIVRSTTKRPTIMTDGSRKFYPSVNHIHKHYSVVPEKVIVLYTINSTVSAIPTCIAGKVKLTGSPRTISIMTMMPHSQYLRVFKYTMN